MSPRASSPRPARITLVRPPVVQQELGFSYFGGTLPIGLAYVAAALGQAGHALQVVDGPGEALERWSRFRTERGWLQLNGLTPDEIVERIDPEADVLAVTHTFLHEWPMVREICERAKAARPGLTVVLGGENATSFAPWILSLTDAVDHCVLGEGEATVVSLVERLQAGAPLDDLPGIASRGPDGRAIVPEGPPPRLDRIDEIPWPAWDLWPVERYLAQANNFGVHRGRSMPMLATRGCPYRCTFCSSPQMWTTAYRTRDPAEVVREMRHYVETHGAQNFDFCDLTAVVQKRWIHAFLDELRGARLDVTWQIPAGTRTEVLDGPVLTGLYETGCRNVTYAPEAGSRRMLEVLAKKVKVPRMMDSMRAAHRAGLVVRMNVILGHPEERAGDVLRSVGLVLRAAAIGCRDLGVMLFSPYPGSADFDRLHREGAVTVDDDYVYLALIRGGRKARSFHPRWSARRLQAMQLSMLLAFYAAAFALRPWRLLEMLQSLASGQERTTLDQFLRVKRRQLLESLPAGRRRWARAT